MAAASSVGQRAVRHGAGSGPWLRSPTFDLALIAGVASVALLLGSAALALPSLFMFVVYADLWLLAYPHVASTYTRVAFDRTAVRQHWFLLFALPPIVLAATAGAAWAGGAIVVNTVYFYWQTWHYTRQSYGIARVYVRDLATDCVVYAFPVWGLLHRAHQHPAEFFGSPLWSPLVPRGVELAAGVVALSSLAVWTWQRTRPARADVPPRTGHVLFVLSHVVITVVSYIVVDDVTQGWLFINIWHNAQYLLFVWAFNARRFDAGVDPSRRFLSRLSQRENVFWYAAFFLGLSTVCYFVLGRLTTLSSPLVLPMVLVGHQAVNFHHYIVDAVVWRSPARRASSPS